MGVYTGFTFLMRAGGSMAVLPASVQLMGNHKISLELINFFSPLFWSLYAQYLLLQKYKQFKTFSIFLL